MLRRHFYAYPSLDCIAPIKGRETWGMRAATSASDPYMGDQGKPTCPAQRPSHLSSDQRSNAYRPVLCRQLRCRPRARPRDERHPCPCGHAERLLTPGKLAYYLYKKKIFSVFQHRGKQEKWKHRIEAVIDESCLDDDDFKIIFLCKPLIKTEKKREGEAELHAIGLAKHVGTHAQPSATLRPVWLRNVRTWPSTPCVAPAPASTPRTTSCTHLRLPWVAPD